MPLYLAPQMDLSIDLAKTTGPTFSGKGGAENQAMLDINKNINKNLPFENAELFQKPLDMPLADFLKQMDEYKASSLQLIADTKGTPYYTKTQQQAVDYNIRSAISKYHLKYGIDPVIQKQSMDYMVANIANRPADFMTKVMEYQNKMHVLRLPIEDTQTIFSKVWEGFDVNNANLYKFSDTYRTMLDQRLSTLQALEGSRTPSFRGRNIYQQKLLTIGKEVSNPYVKDRLLYTAMQMVIRPGDSLTVDYNKYMTVATDPYYKDLVTASYNNLLKYSPGKPAPLFTYNTPDEKPVSLSSLKGSYVYIDVWATWCGPCIAEIPSLKKVEEQYHDKNIKFVSLSIDDLKDKTKWKNYVADNKLGGIQIMADNAWKSGFVKSLNINSIPRFILIDPKGNIVSADAPRPSNAELVKLLDKSLETM
ncbi:TlpA family protein disulfide reductase [Mucilaginibacter myungsuensis]|uniref:TlpA family protein disulfide reductase n=2 Tax=Mucilaginibacter myungsuensis TaxID=649104 RepID=A0A929PVT3_9SPHI|nr:TlpA family protein disulfide reductase [Mucilaginibacter myungsuensis]